MTAYVSGCCGAHITAAGRTTRYYVCRGCAMPCDAVIPPGSLRPGDRIQARAEGVLHSTHATVTTPRGFITYDEFPDSYGTTVTIRESSAASEPKVWIFAESAEHEPAAAHLSVPQAVRVRDALDTFIREEGKGT